MLKYWKQLSFADVIDLMALHPAIAASITVGSLVAGLILIDDGILSLVGEQRNA